MRGIFCPKIYWVKRVFFVLRGCYKMIDHDKMVLFNQFNKEYYIIWTTKRYKRGMNDVMFNNNTYVFYSCTIILCLELFQTIILFIYKNTNTGIKLFYRMYTSLYSYFLEYSKVDLAKWQNSIFGRQDMIICLLLFA